jgi:hypothetical protein
MLENLPPPLPSHRSAVPGTHNQVISCSSVFNILLNFVIFLYLAQTPAPVNNLDITPYQYAAQVTWRLPTPQYSSYITKIIIYLNGAEYQTVSRETTRINIKRFKPNTRYKVDIQTEDIILQKSENVSKSFMTNTAGNVLADTSCRFGN